MQLMTIPKYKFKAKALEYFRLVEETGVSLTITNFGIPTIKVSQFKPKSSEEILKDLRGSVLKYDDPFEPVGLEDWDALK